MKCAQSKTDPRDPKSTVEFTINDAPYTVSKDIPPGTSLNVFIRDYANLRGTKFMCLEGGCGACIVAAGINGETIAVNSCLVPVLICNGWAIKTIEGIGNKKDGYHPIQVALAQNNGTQCGYCSPAMVMNLYSLLQDKKLTMKEIENSFGNNICRCTGYRPILDTFKGFASDATEKLAKDIRDIEELGRYKLCKKTGLACTKKCQIKDQTNQPIRIQLDGAVFHKVSSVDEVFGVFQSNPNATYILHGGNTAHGVYRVKPPEIYIDVNGIPDLHRVCKTDDSLTLGGGVSMTTAMESFEKYSKDPGFEYLRHLAKHIDLIATVPVRNVGSIGGNLMIKHQHHEFPSDLFLIFETAGAELHIIQEGMKSAMTLLDFLEFDMKHKIIYSINLPALSNEYVYRSYKIMPRAQNAHAHVNAGFLFKLDGAGKVLKKPNIIIGGINEHFLHATNTEDYLNGKSLLDKNVLKEAINILDSEMQPDHVLPDYSPQFRKTLAEGLFYKFVLSVKPEIVDPKLRSGGSIMERELSSGHHDYDTDKNVWPMTEPVPKLEAIYQTSGEAEYVNDIPSFPHEVFCAFVLSTVASGKIESIDASQALKLKGVIAFYSAKDIPGKNVFISAATKEMLLPEDEELFASNEVHFAGQAVGVIVAKTNALAGEAAQMVKIKYKNPLSKKPIITIDDAIQSNDDSRFFEMIHIDAKTKGNNTKHVLKGIFDCGMQYHYTMEPQTCVCVPCEDGIDVYPSAQGMDIVQVNIAECLNVKNNSINIKVRRLGGGYGAKISRPAQTACACALVCHKLNRPTRFIQSIESNMMAVGKRYATRQEYEVGVDDDGKLQYVNTTIWGNSGYSYNDQEAMMAGHHLTSCYDPSTWTIQIYETRTDIPTNTYCRAPGSTEAIGMTENIMEHIAKVTGKDPTDVRLANMNEDDKKLLQPMIDEISKTADYEMRKRAVETFNNENRWKKKGISLAAMMYPQIVFGQYNALVSIYARDGTVSVTHGGIEIGQGLNTKVAQVAAHTLGIDLSFVSVKPSLNLTAPNNTVTGGSVTSDACSYATMMACKELLKRLEPIKQELNNPTWPELTMAALAKDVDLCARYMYTTKDDIKPYPIYGVAIAEVEIDVLTGQHIIHRADIMVDAGRSLSPEIDLGQAEGAFVMGIGYWTSEDIIFDPNTGELTNHRTWNYKPPGAKDIPVDFRVYFRRNASNPFSVLRSKATGEPPLCLSCAIPNAIRNALTAARRDAGNNEVWYRLDRPLTTERILLSGLTQKEQMTL